MTTQTESEFRAEIKALSKLIESKKNAAPHWSVYSYLFQSQYKIRHEPHHDIINMGIIRAQQAKMSDSMGKIKTWIQDQPSVLSVKARKIDEILIKNESQQRPPSSRQKSLFYDFLKTLDITCLCLHYLSVRHGQMMTHEHIELDKIVTWFVENVPKMDISRYMLYATDESYAWNSSLLRKRISEALDEDFETKKIKRTEKVVQIGGEDDPATTWYKQALMTVFDVFGSEFDRISSDLGIEVRWKDIQDEQVAIFDKDEVLYEKFADLAESKDDMSLVSEIMADIYVYIANTTIEIIEDEVAPGTDPRAEQVDEVMCHVLTHYARPDEASLTEVLN